TILDALPICSIGLEIAKIQNSRTLDHSTVLEIAKILISRTLHHSTVLEIAKIQISGALSLSTVLEIAKIQNSRTLGSQHSKAPNSIIPHQLHTIKALLDNIKIQSRLHNLPFPTLVS